MGRRAYGWTADDKDIVEHEAQVLRQVAADLIAPDPEQRKSMRQIVRELNAAGSLTGYNAQWTIQSLKRMLINPRMIGRRNNTLGYVVTRGPLHNPPILDEGVWLKVRQELNKKANRHGRSNPRPAELAGVLRCANCDELLYRQNLRDRNARYSCHSNPGCGNNTVSAVLVESWVAQQLVAHIAAEIAETETPHMTALEVAAWWTRADALARGTLIADYIEHITVSNTSRHGHTDGDPDRFDITWKTPATSTALASCA